MPKARLTPEDRWSFAWMTLCHGNVRTWRHLTPSCEGKAEIRPSQTGGNNNQKHDIQTQRWMTMDHGRRIYSFTQLSQRQAFEWVTFEWVHACALHACGCICDCDPDAATNALGPMLTLQYPPTQTRVKRPQKRTPARPPAPAQARFLTRMQTW